MPYIQETAVCGRVVEVEKRFAARYGRPGKTRGDNTNETDPAMQVINRRLAEKKLRRLINTNFGPGDFHLVLTYRRGPEGRPEPAVARRNMERFLRELRKFQKRRGDELRYISVTEYRRAAIHHHMVMQASDAAGIARLWPHGRIHVTPLDDSGNYARLAEYLIKETEGSSRKSGEPYGKRWCASKNLKKPEITVRVVPADSWRQVPAPMKGYRILQESVVEGVHEVTGAIYQRYMMVKLRE